jgi:hypothetical protein
VIEKPEGLVALATSDMSGETDRQDQRLEEQRDEKPHLPLEAEQESDGRDTGYPGDNPHPLRAPTRSTNRSTASTHRKDAASVPRTLSSASLGLLVASLKTVSGEKHRKRKP